MTPITWTFATTLEYGFNMHNAWYDLLWYYLPWVIFPPWVYITFGVILWFLD